MMVAVQMVDVQIVTLVISSLVIRGLFSFVIVFFRVWLGL